MTNELESMYRSRAAVADIFVTPTRYESVCTAGLTASRSTDDAAQGDEGDGDWVMVNSHRRKRGRGRGAAVGEGAAGREEREDGRSGPVLSVSVAHAIDDALVRGAAEVEERRRFMDPATKGQFVR
ncbi:hypothetical protein BDK51DRAFT_33588 [Blyttiomyces helicus]|uniref:Uncharacterized protein n=1 Tax=Blyttiomyces helicus TaxID=388810 RepID=A0A4P9VUN1_9FUNG|nr:hypothetical protein BDK51DRAFT_33588 [Blyttiomyces helicus]|eukprot:RKO83301.1 hypothetical protein BDK51DRAFT_33588 [Blyttiomyces helicus]